VEFHLFYNGSGVVCLQIIQEFCKSVGAPKLKGKLIRQAKQNGERLGFLA